MFCFPDYRFFPSGIDRLPPPVVPVLLPDSPQARNDWQPDINTHTAATSASTPARKKPRPHFFALNPSL
ncbi:hypothetical protein CKA38_06575 [Ereboglobus luteus]|uniref:Uncharacterized protein n=1 Tax=Ereboglobus luteus TaxID=1796921 RepID=A0A2U8E256_9BACT|nr:hypothetical protein CKA38_06575 [Ereboglobus luteus]